VYRLLEVGEVIEKGDEIWSDKKGWFSAELSIGENVPTWAAPMRRLVNPAVTPAASVVNVGDRVKVLSGPWAGCTGVVIGSLPMNLKIKMDNVFVGGNNLTMIVGKTSSVELLPPVVPEVLYRDLSHGETIRKGDEIQMTKQGKWEPVSSSSGTKVGDNHSDGRLYFFRRPIRLQSPGWRYLDAGETVQAGDEAAFNAEPIWRPALEHFFAGYAIRGLDKEHSETFRRKLPANQGG